MLKSILTLEREKRNAERKEKSRECKKDIKKGKQNKGWKRKIRKVDEENERK